MISEENGQNLNCTLTFIKPKMNDSGLYTVKETVDESRDVNFELFLGSFQVRFWQLLLIVNFSGSFTSWSGDDISGSLHGF